MSIGSRAGGSSAGMPGTVAYAAVAYLRTLKPGTELSTAALASCVGQPTSGFGTLLQPAVKAELLNKRMQSGLLMWSLGLAAIDPAHRPAQQTQDEPIKPRTEPVVALGASAVTSIFAMADTRHAAPFAVFLGTDGRVKFERAGRLLLELTPAEADIARKTLHLGVKP